VQIHQGIVEKKIHQTFEVTSNGTGILCREEGWEEENGARLLVPQ